MIIGYSTQAMEALDGLAAFNRAAYVIAILRIQGRLASADDGVIGTTVAFSVDDDTYAVHFAASVIGVEATIHDLDWQVSGV